MMTKKHSHKIWNYFLKIKPIYFFIAFVLCTGLSVYALRQNNLTMAKLREQVYTADKNNGNVEAALEKLQAYVTTHMNTNLSNGPNAPYPPIQLQYTYQRLQAQATQSVSKSNLTLYTQAENYCQTIIPHGFSGIYRVPCIEKYIKGHGIQVPRVPQGLYEFDFLSPTWSPDLAGWSLVASAFLLLMFIVSYIAHRINKYKLQKLSRSQ